MPMTDDRWWRGFDTVILDALPPGSRVLDVGCGDGGFVDRIAAQGLDAVGIDPAAPDAPRLIQETIEQVGDIGDFDAICAFMSLHHADLEPVFRALTHLLRPERHLFVYEFAWDVYDERAATWLAAHDRSGADNSVAGWQAEHAGLHRGDTIRESIMNAFDLRTNAACPYLARMLAEHDLQAEEQSLINEGTLPALGRWYVAQTRHR
jgi:SAM-dependent methyltransferase